MSMGKKVALYARVSTSGQSVENQLRELRQVAARHDWEVSREYCDKGVSGSRGRDKRPQFDELLKAVARKEFDMVLSWSVDRLGRSLQHLVGFLADLQDKKVDLYLHVQGVDTSTAGGKALFQMMGIFAEFERSLIVERVKSGLQRAKASGKTLGRPKVGYGIEKKILEMRMPNSTGQVMGIKRIAKSLGVGTGTVQRVIKAA